MPTVSEIKRAIEQLPPEDFVRLREWFVELDAARWDLHIECDAASGRLDGSISEALDDLMNGLCTEL